MEPILGELIRQVAGGSLAAVFAILWWLERGERREKEVEVRAQQQRFEERVDRMTAAMGENATGFALLRQLVGSGRP